MRSKCSNRAGKCCVGMQACHAVLITGLAAGSWQEYLRSQLNRLCLLVYITHSPALTLPRKYTHMDVYTHARLHTHHAHRATQGGRRKLSLLVVRADP